MSWCGMLAFILNNPFISYLHLPLSVADILPQFKEWLDEYGGIYKLEVLGMKYAILAEPEVVEVRIYDTLL